jgi:site-specific recombinase XerD
VAGAPRAPASAGALSLGPGATTGADVPWGPPRQDDPLPEALNDAAVKLLGTTTNDKRLLVRVTVEVLLPTGRRVGQFTSLPADAVVQIGAAP